MKMLWKRQDLACIPAPYSPFQQAAILLKARNASQPLGARRACNDHHIRHVARPHTATDGQLDSLQKAPFAPLGLKPFGRNFGQTTAAAAITNCDLSNYEALCFKSVLALFAQSQTSRGNRSDLAASSGLSFQLGNALAAALWN